MHSSVSDAFHSAVSKAQPSFTANTKNTNETTKTNINMNFAYLSIKLVKYYPFLFVLYHLKHGF